MTSWRTETEHVPATPGAVGQRRRQRVQGVGEPGDRADLGDATATSLGSPVAVHERLEELLGTGEQEGVVGTGGDRPAPRQEWC